MTSRTDPASRKTAVIIPYYQEEPGILREAVLSAIAQEGVSDLEIIVVDDGSPAPARDDLQGLDLPAHVTLKLIEQPNRGPGAARNRGLDDVPQDTVYVAFLDSDDRWTRPHLQHAQLALDAGSDLYFSDYGHYDTVVTHFERSDFDTGRHDCIDYENHLYRFTGEIDICIASGQCAIQTVVYRYDKFADLRFPESFWVGEDSSFLLQLSGFAQGAAFSARVECISGPGIHIFKSSGWGAPRAIWVLSEWMRSRQWVQNNVKLSPGASKVINHSVNHLRKNFVSNLLHETRGFRVFKNRHVVDFLLHDPAVMLHLVPIVVRLLFENAKTQRDGRSSSQNR